MKGIVAAIITALVVFFLKKMDKRGDAFIFCHRGIIVILLYVFLLTIFKSGRIKSVWDLLKIKLERK